MVDYQDNLIVHSKIRDDHIHHLRKLFDRCKLYGVSLNPKKCLFVVTQGKLLGHIVCKEGIYIDPERVKSINEINTPSSKKGVQSFFGKINFVRTFVPDYASIVKPINLLLKRTKGLNGPQIHKKIFIISKRKSLWLQSSLAHIFKESSSFIRSLQKWLLHLFLLRGVPRVKNYQLDS